MSVVQNKNNNHWIPNEVPMTAIGTTISAISGVATQILSSPIGKHWIKSTTLLNFAYYGFAATGIAGVVITIYSMARLCQKMISERSALDKTVATTALGILFAAVTETLAEHFYNIAPSFGWLEGRSIAYAIGTNLAWEASAVLGLGSLVFTGCAAYKAAQIGLNTTEQPQTQEISLQTQVPGY